MQSNLEILKKLEAEATPGPWKSSGADSGHKEVVNGGNGTHKYWIVDVCPEQADADLIAATRQALSLMLAVVEAITAHLKSVDEDENIATTRHEVVKALAAFNAANLGVSNG